MTFTITARTASFLLVLLATLAAATDVLARERQVAITIDDLPRGGDGGSYDAAGMRAMTAKLMQPFREQKIPVIGFVNAGRWPGEPRDLRDILDIWLDAGAELGNHSNTHPDINTVPLEAYTADITKGEGPIRAALEARGRKLEFYRHPYLHTGPTPETRKSLQDFLRDKGYRVAPVTFDDADYAFAAAYTKPATRERVRREYVPYMESIVEFFEKRSMEVLGYEPPQILLIHANQMNADLMPELLAMFRRRGYTFISVSRALEDPAYQLPDEYVGRNGFSWIHRWSKTKGLPEKREPDAPEWVMKAFEPPR